MMIRENKTKRKLQAGETVFGVFVPMAAPRMVEICGLAGFDYVIIDAEHGPIDVSECEHMVRAAEVVEMTPIVRVPSHDPKIILRYLDAGAQGVMVPQVNSAAEAKAAVEAVKYVPMGKRGLGPGRAAAYGQEIPLSEYAAHANAETLIIAQLEHINALAQLPEILAVEGIDAFELGLADLSQSMGFPGQGSRPEVQRAVDQFVSGVLQAGRIIGDTANTVEAASTLMKQGYKMIDCNVVGVAMGALKRLSTGMREGVVRGSS